MTWHVWRNMDWVLAGSMLAAAFLGVVAIASVSGTGLSSIALHQAFWVVLGSGAFIVFAHLDYHILPAWRHWIYGLMVLLLLAVFVLGHNKLGAERSIAFGPLQLEPVEPVKLLLIVSLAIVLEPRIGTLRRLRDLIVPSLYAAVPVLLVMAEPDLGSSMVLISILLVMLFAAGYSGSRLLLLVILGLALVIGLIIAHLRWNVPIPLHGYQLDRLIAFLNPQANALNYGLQTIESEVAIGSGRIYGTGLFSTGISHQLAYVPERASDFIFAAISNQFGLYGALVTVALESLITWRALRCMIRARDGYGGLIAAGVAAMIGCQAFLNIGVALGLLPVTGVPLPFISQGGSAALADFAAVGLLESVYIRSHPIPY